MGNYLIIIVNDSQQRIINKYLLFVNTKLIMIVYI